MKKVKGYKAYNKGLVCKDFQFEENKTFTIEGEPIICQKGFHFYENPLDTLNYYDLCESEFTTVEAIGNVTHNEDTKIATNKIKIGKKLSLHEFINASIAYLIEQNKIEAASGNYSKLAASGDYSKLAASGDYSQLAASGDFSKLELNGNKSVGANIGINGTIKGVKGSWITLAEYNSNYECICIKSAIIDGIELKENTWYKLKKGLFTETNN